MTEDSPPERYDQRSHLRARMADAIEEMAFVAPQLREEDYENLSTKFENDELERIMRVADQLND